MGKHIYPLSSGDENETKFDTRWVWIWGCE